MNYKYLLFTYSFILFFSLIGKAQDTIPNIDTVPYDSDFVLSDTVPDDDSTLTEEIELDDNLNSIFSDQMDSMLNSWDTKNRFSFDTSEVNLIDYPKSYNFV